MCQDGFTVLHWAAISGGAKDALLRYLLKSEGLITATDKVKFLLENNIEVSTS